MNTSAHLVRITKDHSAADLFSEEISKLDMYEIQVKKWIFEPAVLIAGGQPRNTDHGMALLALCLMFFEPHGKIILGKPNEKSGISFRAGFDPFLEFLKKDDTHTDLADFNIRKFYSSARCGMFHASFMNEDFLVDSISYLNHSLAKNPIIPGSWLIDPWLLLEDIQTYFESFLEGIRSSPASEDSVNLDSTINTLVVEPLKKITSKF